MQGNDPERSTIDELKLQNFRVEASRSSYSISKERNERIDEELIEWAKARQKTAPHIDKLFQKMIFESFILQRKLHKKSVARRSISRFPLYFEKLLGVTRATVNLEDIPKRSLPIEAERFADKFLPKQARTRVFEPYYQELLEQYYIDSTAAESPQDIAKIGRRFMRAVRGAALQSLGLYILGVLRKWCLWVATAIAGDGVVKLTYWACSELYRRISS